MVATPVERFRGRIRKPRVSDAEHGRIEVRVSAWGLWQRLRRSQDVAVPEIQDANGKQAVDAVLDQIPMAHVSPQCAKFAQWRGHRI